MGRAQVQILRDAGRIKAQRRQARWLTAAGIVLLVGVLIASNVMSGLAEQALTVWILLSYGGLIAGFVCFNAGLQGLTKWSEAPNRPRRERVILAHQLGNRRSRQPGPTSPHRRTRKVGRESQIEQQVAVVVGQRSRVERTPQELEELSLRLLCVRFLGRDGLVVPLDEDRARPRGITTLRQVPQTERRPDRGGSDKKRTTIPNVVHG